MAGGCGGGGCAWFRGGSKKSSSGDHGSPATASHHHLLPLSCTGRGGQGQGAVSGDFQQFKLISNRLHNYETADERNWKVSSVKSNYIIDH